jgi:hypothetical protein
LPLVGLTPAILALVVAVLGAIVLGGRADGAGDADPGGIAPHHGVNL